MWFIVLNSIMTFLYVITAYNNLLINCNKHVTIYFSCKAFLVLVKVKVLLLNIRHNLQMTAVATTKLQLWLHQNVIK